VKILAHRANLNGPGSGDNRPESIRACLERGVGVEVDVLGVNGELWFGHDRPERRADVELLARAGVMCHAKDIQAASILRSLPVSFFCLGRDEFALCSNGLIWSNYGCMPTAASIMCSPELVGAPESIEEFYPRVATAYGVCTDHPLTYVKLLGREALNGILLESSPDW